MFTWVIWFNLHTVKFREKAPGLTFFKGPFWEAYFWRGLSTEGNLGFKMDWASLIVGSTLPFLLVSLYLEGRFYGGFFVLPFRGLIFGGAYFRNFTVWLCYHLLTLHQLCWKCMGSTGRRIEVRDWRMENREKFSARKKEEETEDDSLTVIFTQYGR